MAAASAAPQKQFWNRTTALCGTRINMSETIKAIVAGKDRIIAVWEWQQAGDLYTITKNAAREIEHTNLRLDRIINNSRLSAEAKRDDRKDAGLDSLKTLAKSAARLEGLRVEHQARTNRLAAVAPYSDGDAATALIDLEIARHLAAMKDESARVIMLVTGEQPRLTEAVLRLPPMLSGLSDAEHRRISAAAIERANPTESRLVADEAEQLNTASKAVTKAFKLIVEMTGAELVAQVAVAGEQAAQLVNVPQNVIESIQARAERGAA